MFHNMIYEFYAEIIYPVVYTLQSCCSFQGGDSRYDHNRSGYNGCTHEIYVHHLVLLSEGDGLLIRSHGIQIIIFHHHHLGK